MMTTVAYAQITVTLGNNTSYSYSFPNPYADYYRGAKHQILILGSELIAAGAGAGIVSSLSFKIPYNGTYGPLKDFTIRMKNASFNELSPLFEKDDLRTVYTPKDFLPKYGWNKHILDSAFIWDGISNLLIEACFDNGGFSQFQAIQIYYSPTDFNSVSYYSTSNTEICNSVAGMLSKDRPDMQLEMQPNVAPPLIKFTVNGNFSCAGDISFSDLSINNPSSWLWDFGDGTTSVSQNAAHSYAAPGTYTVKLISCNNNACDSLVKVNYIMIDTMNKPLCCSCTPATQSYCCGYGIYKVMLNELNHTSGDASSGYEDFSCTGTMLTLGKPYNLFIETGPNEPQNTSVWIDYNNDGVLNASAELAFSSQNTFNPSGIIFIPADAVTDTPLLMRAISSDAGSSPAPCSDVSSGQAEDYTVYIFPNSDKPVADFMIKDSMLCDESVTFADLSANVPDSWFWDFGDGKTDTVQHPVHIYTSEGIYDIQFKACNKNGCDSVTKSENIIVHSNSSGPVAPSCTPVFYLADSSIGLVDVEFESISNISAAREGYKDYSCSYQASLVTGNSYIIYLQVGSSTTTDARVWIDYNNDGELKANGELVFSSDNSWYHSGDITIPSNAVTGVPLRMRIITDVSRWWYPLLPCNNYYSGEAEDYAVILSKTSEIKELRDDDFFTLSPNPVAASPLEIKGKLNGKKEVGTTIYNLLGKQVYHRKGIYIDECHIKLDVSFLPAGMYLLKLSGGERKIIRKIVVR